MTDRTSLENLEKYWIPKIIENADEEVELAIIGNKTDLNNERQVSKQEAAAFISKMGKQLKKSKNENDKSSRYQANVIANTSYFEISAKESDNVNNVFKSLLTKITQNEALIEKIKMSN